MRRGLEFLERPRPEDQQEAERLLRKALAIDPDLSAAHAGLARIAIYLYTLGLEETPERIAAALAEARRAAALAPNDVSAHAVLALALAASGRLTPALEEARRATDLDPASADAQVALAIVLRQRRQIQESLAACHRAAESKPDSPRVLATLAETLREDERYDEALEMYGQAIDLDHEAIAPQLGAAATLVKAGNALGARRLYSRLLKTWDYAQNRIRLAVAALDVVTQDYEHALATYAQVELPENGTLPTLLALYGKGFALLRLGRAAEAEYFLSTIIDRVPSDYDGPARGREILFRAYDDLIDYFKERGRTRKADALLRAACDRPLAPTRFGRRLAESLAASGKTDGAGEALEKALLGSDPLEDPIEISETALALARLRSSEGRRAIRDGSATARALTAAAERIASSPLGIAHYRLARAQSLAHQGAAAIASLERARDNGYLPADRLAQEADFEPIRGEPAFRSLLNP